MLGTRRGIEVVKFDELDESWVQTGQIWTRCVFIGVQNNCESPVGIAIRAGRDVGDLVAGKRSFGTTVVLTVLSGLMMHDGRWMAAGDIYVSPPGEMAGDTLFGPNGAVIFLLFNKRSGMVPTFGNADDQANFNKLYRSDVEEVASGRAEKSVSILPLRTETTSGRAIVYNTAEEVENYRRQIGGEW